MGAYVSYMWVGGADVEKAAEEERKWSDPSYTIQYPPQEEDFLKRVEEEEEERKVKASVIVVGKLPEEQWAAMTNKYVL